MCIARSFIAVLPDELFSNRTPNDKQYLKDLLFLNSSQSKVSNYCTLCHELQESESKNKNQSAGSSQVALFCRKKNTHLEALCITLQLTHMVLTEIRLNCQYGIVFIFILLDISYQDFGDSIIQITRSFIPLHELFRDTDLATLAIAHTSGTCTTISTHLEEIQNTLNMLSQHCQFF